MKKQLTQEQKDRLLAIKYPHVAALIERKKTNVLLDKVNADFKGEKGDKGDKGDTGAKGEKGDSIKGDKGEQGISGLNGRDGRDGLDGQDGKDGADGINGKNGRDGKDGVDGKLAVIDEEIIKQQLEPHIKTIHSNIARVIDGMPRGSNYGGFIETPLKAGANVTITKDGSGANVISSSGSGGGSSVATQSVSGTINGSNTSFTVSTSMASALAIYLDGIPYQPGVDFTVSGTNITFTTAPDKSLSGTPFWVMYSTSGTFYEDTVSGTINGSNVTFTVPNTIGTALTLFLNGIPYQPGVDFTASGTTITMAVAPDSSLSGSPFWLLHS